MAGTTNDLTNGAPFYLDSNQHNLLLAALASNNQDPSNLFSTDPTFFTSPQQSTPANAFTSGSIEESPYGDFLDGDTSFDYDNGDTGDLMIGALPGDSPSGKSSEDSTEKRKSPGDDDEDIDGGGKRREGEDKQAKKPGRKPLTSEPTTVGSTAYMQSRMAVLM
jgi:AP-1-like factor